MSAGRILVVDDMALCREPIGEALRARGYEVLCAADGTDALSLVRRQRPDLVLLDVNLPGMSGLAVLRAMRNDPELKQLPVIMLTERADRQAVAETAELGVRGYLLKSAFSLEELYTRVKACLEGTAAAPRTPALVGVAATAGTTRPTERAGFLRWRAAVEPSSSAAEAGSATARPPAARSRGDAERSSVVSAASDGCGLGDLAKLNELTPVITKAELTKLVNEGLALRPLGPTVQNVIAVTGSAGCSAEDVAKAVTRDQALCIRILKLASSSAYARGRPADSVKEAVQRIGVREVRSLVMTLGVMQHYEGGAGKHVDPHLFWEHSIACGLIASAITRRRHADKVDDSFLWGMVHDVGRLILLDHVSDQYAMVWEAAERLACPLEAVEGKMMLLNHCDILERALDHWQFPRDFIAPVVSHHHSLHHIQRLGPVLAEQAATVALANRLAHALLLGSSGNEVLSPLDDLVTELKIQPREIAQLTERIPDETRDLKITMLARSGEAIWPDYPAEVRKRLGRDIRPLCVSVEPAVDACRIFFDRVAAGPAEQPPNLGVIYAREAEELPTLIVDYDTAAENGDAWNAPVLIVLGKGRLDTSHPWFRSRRHAILHAPLPLSALVRTIHELMK